MALSYRRILVPVDGSPTSLQGLAQAIRLAASGAELKLLHVLESPTYAYGALDYGFAYDELFEHIEAEGRRVLNAAMAQARKAKVKAVAEMVEARGEPVAEVISRHANRWKAELIVMGSHGRRGLSRVLMGSDAEAVMRNTRLPLLLTRPAPAGSASRRGFRKIIVPLDGSTTARAGLRTAIAVATDSGAALRLVHVIDLAPGFHAPGTGSVLAGIRGTLRKRGQTLLAQAEKQAAAAGVKSSSTVIEKAVGPAADAIASETSKSGADLIVIGTHGRRGLARALMGSDAELVVRQTKTPVLLVRGR